MTDAQRLVDLLESFQRDGTTVMDLARGGQPAEAWRLYPSEAGIFDLRTHDQFCFHTHDDGRDEHGHFHTVRLFHDCTVHIMAISMGHDGWPRALFTANTWATGDAYESAARVKAYARRFRIDEGRGPALLIRFVNLVYRALLPEIERLQDEKLATLTAHRVRHPTRDPFVDRSLDILSWIDIDLRRRLASAPPYLGSRCQR